MLALACPGWRREGEGGAPVQRSTAGPTWERFLAATFPPASESADFLVGGRGVTPFSVSPASMAPAAGRAPAARATHRVAWSAVAAEGRGPNSPVAWARLRGPARDATCYSVGP